MATKTVTTLIDDLDGSEALETVAFSFKDTQYEIDLSKTNLQNLIRALEPYTTAGRKTTKPGSRPSSAVREQALAGRR